MDPNLRWLAVTSRARDEVWLSLGATAISEGTIYLRTYEALFAIAEGVPQGSKTPAR